MDRTLRELDRMDRADKVNSGWDDMLRISANVINAIRLKEDK